MELVEHQQGRGRLVADDVLIGMLIVSNSLVLKFELKQVALTSSWWHYLQEGWNKIDVAGIVALYVASAAHFIGAPFVASQVGGVGVFLNAISGLKLLQHSPSTSTLIKVIIMTVNDEMVQGFLKVLAVLTAGFAGASAVSMPTNEAFFTANGTVFPGILTTTMAVVGDFDVDQYALGVPTLMFIIFLYLVIIVMFNVLIAIVSDLYADAKETADVEEYLRRAEAIIDEEKLMVAAGDTELHSKACFPEFLEVLRVEREISGGQQAMVSQVQERVTQLSAKVDENIEEQTKHNAKVVKMADDMAELKALVAQLVKQTKPAATATRVQFAVKQVMAHNRAKQRSPLGQ